MSRTGDFLVFRLSLGPTVWRIAAAPELKDWIQQFARILGLSPWKEATGSVGIHDERKLFVFPDSETPDENPPPALFQSKLGGRLPPDGWNAARLSLSKMWRHPQAPAVILQVRAEGLGENGVLAMSEACLPFYIRVIETGGMPLHAALLSRDGGAVALAAPGSTGKSTCARRVPRPWRELGDDLGLITAENTDAGAFMAQPFPTWSDYIFKRSERTWAVETRLPLRAVFFLSQSGEDRAFRMGQGEAAINISQSGHQILSVPARSLPLPELRRLRAVLFDNACRLVLSLPVYRLEFSLTGSFWREIERLL
ncbi:MAG: SynChlorMet cassette protein ScmC [Candidatus Aminicenantes bacterium RBG_13_62_12]|nr:MAG: SynChlorMet cassette protein ScmC [Candidatus Aminicenantes bacterium RBG_13_62_12]